MNDIIEADKNLRAQFDNDGVLDFHLDNIRNAFRMLEQSMAGRCLDFQTPSILLVGIPR